jgi:hypothetical protein
LLAELVWQIEWKAPLDDSVQCIDTKQTDEFIWPTAAGKSHATDLETSYRLIK